MRLHHLPLLAVLGMTAGSVGAVPPKPMSLTKAEAGRPIPVKAGTPIVLRLESNPSTGHAWRVLRQNNAAVSQPIRVHEPRNRPAGLVGAPGTAVVRIALRRRGRATVVLGYAPAFDADAKAEETLRFVFDVR